MPVRKTLPLEEFKPPEAFARTYDVPERRMKKYLVPAAAVLVVIALASAYYFYTQYATLAKNPNVAVEKETKELVAELSKLIVLPEETPTIATVSEAELLRDQKFFANAENGDKLLAYPASQQAILYRPSKRLIIAVAPIVIDAEGP